MVETVDELQQCYCPPLDSSLFLAIVSEYDLSSASGVEAAKQILDSLSGSIDIEEASGFDPSGSSGGGHHTAEEYVNERSESGLSAPEWSSTTDSTSLSQALSVLDVGSTDTAQEYTGKGHSPERSTSVQQHDQWQGLDMAAKEARLIETFPTAKPFDIKWTLNKHKGDATLAIEDLLNQSFLEETGSRYRGVDAFSGRDDSPKPRKGKGRKNKPKSATLSEFQETEPSDQPSKWTRATTDIDFLAERTNMFPQQISSMYHKLGGSLQATISALIDAHISLGLETRDNSTQRAAQSLQPTYPTIPLHRLIALVQLSHPNRDHASELAKALITRSPQSSGNGTPIQLDLRYAPPDLGDTAMNASPARPSTASSSIYREDSQPFLPNTSAELSTLRHAAFNSASSAYRKGKSDPLMGAAAGYYASVGRDLSSRLHASTASEMDMLVSAQSSGEMCDLHGCDVKNGVRIARERVRGWWASKGGSLHGGYTVVTGKGTHSEGGKSRLQPAVVKALMAEGWRVEVLSGSVLVKGVVAATSTSGKKR